MIDEMTDIILVCIGIIVIVLIIFGFGYTKGEDNLIEKLCTQKQYDFCEVIEQKPEYKLKELKQDDVSR